MKRLFCSAVVLSLLSITSQDSQAQIVPFKSVGTFNAYDTSTGVFGGPGKTAHMGKSSGGGLAIPVALPESDPDFGNPLVSGWIGFGEFVAANGDRIEFSGGGKIYFEPLGGGWFTAAWIGEFDIVDINGDGKAGDGRFANVGPGTAPLSVIAINDPFQLDATGMPLPGAIWTYDYEIRGDMNLGKKK